MNCASIFYFPYGGNNVRCVSCAKIIVTVAWWMAVAVLVVMTHPTKVCSEVFAMSTVPGLPAEQLIMEVNHQECNTKYQQDTSAWYVCRTAVNREFIASFATVVESVYNTTKWQRCPLTDDDDFSLLAPSTNTQQCRNTYVPTLRTMYKTWKSFARSYKTYRVALIRGSERSAYVLSTAECDLLLAFYKLLPPASR